MGCAGSAVRSLAASLALRLLAGLASPKKSASSSFASAISASDVALELLSAEAAPAAAPGDMMLDSDSDGMRSAAAEWSMRWLRGTATATALR